MYLKKLIIAKNEIEIIREIKFQIGLNLIVDDTPNENLTDSGNGLGKTTVLKIIDYFFGADKNKIYTGNEGKQSENTEVKNFLIENKVLFILELSKNKDLEETAIRLERNLLSGKDKIQRINNEQYTNSKQYENEVKRLVFNSIEEKPTLRELVKHSIRYEDYAIERLIRHIHPTTKNIEYETLYLFMLGFPISDASEIQKKDTELKYEKKFKERLEKDLTLSGNIALLNSIKREINELEMIKSKSIVNQNFEKDFKTLNDINIEIGTISTQVNNLNLSKNLINRSVEKIKNEKNILEIDKIKQLYENYEIVFKSNINKTFIELVDFHNKMVENKSSYISKELPFINKSLDDLENRLKELISIKEGISKKISETTTIVKYEKLLQEINSKYEEKGKVEKQVSQIKETENRIKDISQQLDELQNDLYSDKYKDKIQRRIDSFNEYFSTLSEKLYGDKIFLTADIKTEKNTNNKYYDFNTYSPAKGSGIKQGEILAFEIAYIIFASKYNIPKISFILNDKKELMHDNQLISFANLIKDIDVQLVFSILYNKLPSELRTDNNILLKLNPNEKLFKF